MNHSFNVEVAIKYGVPCALVLGHIDFMVQKAQTNGEKRLDGKYWMRKSVGEFAELYPYFTKDQIRRAIECLRREKLILSAHFKASECTRTLWYTITKSGKKLLADSDDPAASVPQRNGTSATSERHEGRNDTASVPLPAAQVPNPAASVPQRNGTSAISSIEVLDNVLDIVLEGCSSGSSNSNEAGDHPCVDAAAASPFTQDALVSYASQNLLAMSRDNMDELISFRDTLPDELIRYAINEACASGARRYKYVKSILNRYEDEGFKTIADVEADKERRRREQEAGKARQHSGQPKTYADEDDFY